MERKSEDEDLITRARIILWQDLNLWQKILLVLSLAAAFALAVVLGILILYVVFVLLALGIIVYGAVLIWNKFFAPAHHREDRVRVRRTKDGVVIDGDFEEEK